MKASILTEKLIDESIIRGLSPSNSPNFSRRTPSFRNRNIIRIATVRPLEEWSSQS